VEEINEVVRGWGNYFAIANYGQTFRHSNWFTSCRLRQWLWRKHGNPNGKHRRWPDKLLAGQYGLYQLPGGIFGKG